MRCILSIIFCIVFINGVDAKDNGSEKLVRKRNRRVADEGRNPNSSNFNQEQLNLSEEEELFLRYLQAENSFSFSYPTPSPTSAPTPTPGTPTSAPTTSVPTPVTPAPTTAPNSPPSILTCKNSGVKFRIGGNGSIKRRGCKWVSNNPNKLIRRCKYSGVKSHCPNECGTCNKYACKDSESFWFLWGLKNRNRPRSCEWVRRKANKIFKRCGKNGVAATCRETCGWCS